MLRFDVLTEQPMHLQHRLLINAPVAKLPAAENIPDRDFTADGPGLEMVSGITYIPADEGRLCPAGIMDLCGDKTAGISMYRRMTKELVISALKDAVCHTQSAEGCIPHSDRGKPVLFPGYQALAKRMDSPAA